MERYSRNKEIPSGRLFNELVMIDIKKGIYLSLNPVATYIWDLLENPISFNMLCSLLVEKYDVGVDKCRAEVQEYLEEMKKHGLILKQNESE